MKLLSAGFVAIAFASLTFLTAFNGAQPSSAFPDAGPSLSGHSLEAGEYRLIGTWDEQATEYPSVIRLLPTGTEPHFIETRVADGEWQSHMITLSGEAMVLQHISLWIDWNRTGNIIFESNNTIDLQYANYRSRDDCNLSGGSSAVTGWVLAGECWGPAVINPETGVWHRPCNAAGENNCIMIVSEDTGPGFTVTFMCEGSGEAGGNGNNTVWWNNACHLDRN